MNSPSLRAINLLRQAVDVSERIKRVADIAVEIDMVAINASLAARQGGSHGGGYGVVAAELRELSYRLQDLTETVVDSVFSVVDSTARLLRRQRDLSLIAKAINTNADSHHAQILTGCTARVEKLQVNARQQWRQLDSHIRQTHRACRIGGYLAHCARIEAVHGGVMTQKLQQVATDIDHAFTDIGERMRQISLSAQQ